MKKFVILIVFIVILIILGVFFLREGDDVANDQVAQNVGRDALVGGGSTADCIDMQLYKLCPPENYSCGEGFRDDYKFIGAQCSKENREDYVINAGAGISSTGISVGGSIVQTQITARSFEFTNQQYDNIVCDEFRSRKLNLSGEYYICRYPKGGKNVITIGVGKSIHNTSSPHGVWFEADLVIEKKSDYSEEDYINELSSFLNNSVKIDWDEYVL